MPRRSRRSSVPAAGPSRPPFVLESRSDGEESDPEAWLVTRGHGSRRAQGTPRGSFLARLGRGLVVVNPGPVPSGGESWRI